jgi:signal transduction histidine kinase
MTKRWGRKGATLDDDPVDARGQDIRRVTTIDASPNGANSPMPRRPARIRAAAILQLDRQSLRPGTWQDVALAVVLAALVAVEIVAQDHPDFSSRALASNFVALVSVAAIAWRPRFGDAFLVLSLFCWLLAAALDSALGADLAPFVAVYAIGTRRPWRQAAAAVAATGAVGLVAGLLENRLESPLEAAGSLLMQLLAFGLIAGLGLWIGSRRTYMRTLMDRAEDLEREREVLEREQEERSRQAVAVERARIARELHDVVAHHVSVMVIQAGAAEANLPLDAPAARQAVQAIGETGREAMAEMRRLLGLLRSEASFEPSPDAPKGSNEGPAADAERSPQPGLSDLASLADRTREAGVDVSVEVNGTAHRLPAGVDLSAYRVVQEALTNTLRHAGPGTRASVRIAFEPESLAVEVTDDGRGRPAVASLGRSRSGVGHGLLGMRERVMLYGGRLVTGPLPGGGFRVTATFPLEGPVDPGPAPDDAEPQNGDRA